MHIYRDRLQTTLLTARQFGVAVPGGADVLIHWRTQVEDALRRYGPQALAMIDVDIANACLHLEWDSIR